jgi:metacaspase-1
MASNRRALCVGINNFKNYPGSALHGCVNDANDMEALLKKWLGFTAGDIVKLTDTQATKANIMKNLTDMVNGAKQGKYSYLVFSMSSHGTQVPDIKGGDEPDKADEAFCPHDLAAAGNVWDKKHIIVDDEIHDLFVQLPDNVLLEVYLDTCHSGTGLKAVDLLPDRKPRWMPPPSLEAFKQLEGTRSVSFIDKTLGDIVRSGKHHILWAACRSDQTSADAHIAGGWHGAFTYYFCKVMNDTQNKLPRKDVLVKVKQALIPGHYNQVPQLECPATTRTMPIA